MSCGPLDLNTKIYDGYGKTADIIGKPYDLYRPSNPLNPIGTKLEILNASFNALDMKYKKANLYGQALWYGVFNGNRTQVGDYLIHTSGPTYFIAGMQDLLPILCVECNHTIKIQKQNSGGMTNNDFTDLILHLPVSILEITQSKGKIDSPFDLGQGKYRCLMPNLGVVMATNFIVVDDLNQGYEIMSTELTDLGWRMVMERVRL